MLYAPKRSSSRRLATSLAIVPLLMLGCGGGGADAESQAETPSTAGAESETTVSPEPELAGPAGGQEGQEGSAAGSEPLDTEHANLGLLDAVVAGEVSWGDLLDRDEAGLLVVENHDGTDGELVQNAHHFCHGALERRYEELTEQLRQDLARGRELNDIACIPTPEGPPRTDCSMGGTETAATSHYIFEESDGSVRLESIYRISEVGKDERYVSHAFRFADRQAAQVRRRGCP
jgi:hypothetical protein